MKRQRKDVPKTPFSPERLYDDVTTTFAQGTFGWSLEDIGMQIADMAGSAKETTYSMGDDAPLAALSERPHPLYNYFKQRFAQVTNPPIDVSSLYKCSFIHRQAFILAESHTLEAFF
jgi:glutamate synthase (ferredoxin)